MFCKTKRMRDIKRNKLINEDRCVQFLNNNGRSLQVTLLMQTNAYSIWIRQKNAEKDGTRLVLVKRVLLTCFDYAKLL